MNIEKKRYTKPQAISREELEQALLEANEQLSAANQELHRQGIERAELFRNLAHDLRAPMTALVSTVDLLREKKNMSSEEYTEMLDLMNRRLKNLSAILDDVLLLGQMENPDLQLQLEEIDAAAFLEEFYFSCEADVKYRERSLALDMPVDLQCTVQFDPQKMIRVLDNLFTNALRYSRQGDSITLKVRSLDLQGEEAAESGFEGPALEICVTDTGLGIAQEDLPHIFERSYRADRSRTPGDGGNGLGLAIVKNIVERHGGRIKCESVQDEGSSFIVKLPALTGK